MQVLKDKVGKPGLDEGFGVPLHVGSLNPGLVAPGLVHVLKDDVGKPGLVEGLGVPVHEDCLHVERVGLGHDVDRVLNLYEALLCRSRGPLPAWDWLAGSSLGPG